MELGNNINGEFKRLFLKRILYPYDSPKSVYIPNELRNYIWVTFDNILFNFRMSLIIWR